MSSEESAIQQHFLGCSIRNFNINMGWGGEATTMSIGLVEDDVLFERFDGFVGQLVRFQYDSFIFDGVLTNISEQKSESGNRLWEVVISDPREFLAGVQLIISGYTGGTFNVPNLYNIYGYLESFGYGNSGINSVGIPWRLVRDSFTTINQTSPMYLAGYPYYINLSNLPDVPNDYRIGSSNISLIDFIQEICELANHEFTIVMVGNYINVITVSRNIPILNGSITSLLQRLPQYISTEAGFELQYNTTNKFMVGGQVEQNYFQFNNLSGVPNFDDPIYDDTIARYWGKDENGNVKLAERSFSDTISLEASGTFIETNEKFFLDGKNITWPGRSWYQYPTDMDELRCVIESRESWETFLSFYDKPSNKSGSIHYGKYERLFSPPDLGVDVFRDPFANITNIKPATLAKLERNAYADETNNEVFLQKVYDFLHGFASEHLDKKFMVRIPFVLAKLDTDHPSSFEPSIITSLEPSETGYLEETYINNAAEIGLLPDYSSFVLNEENKLYCYVRFGPVDYRRLDFSEFSEDDYYIQPSSGPSGSFHNLIFIKADVEEHLVFLNKNTAFSPRAVVTLPGRLKYQNEDESDTLNLIKSEYLKNKLDNFIITDPEQREAFQKLHSNLFDSWAKSVGTDTILLNKSKYGLLPEMVSVPLRSNVDTYGPWYTQGYQGKVEFIQDPELVPWNYGGFSNMNAAGTAMVQDVYTNSMIGEAGSVEVPGSPAFSIASSIFAGGPTISQISTTVGDTGVTTTYRMDKWNQQYGKATRHRLETFRNNHIIKRENAKKFNKLFKPRGPDTKIRRLSALTPSLKPRRKQTRSSHTMLMANIQSSESGMVNSANVASVPFYQTQEILSNDNWESIGGVSLDALFAPYSTDVDSSGMPKFETPTNNSGITVNNLNPFKEGHNIAAAVIGAGVSGYRSINLNGEEDVYRGVGLRGPLILTSWGYNTSGLPVPGVSGEFISGYLTDINSWKSGPIDLRWDDVNKKWTSDGIIDLRISGLELQYTKDGINWVTWHSGTVCSGV